METDASVRMLVMGKGNRDRWELALLGLLFSTPILVHHFWGQLPLVDYDRIAGSLSKVQADYQRIERLYGSIEAHDFQTFFITGLILSNLNVIVLLSFFFWKMRRKTFFDGIGKGFSVSKNVSRRKMVDRLAYLAAACVFLILYVWIFPTWIQSPGPGSIFEIRPGVRGELISSIFLGAYSFTLALLITAYANFRANR